MPAQLKDDGEVARLEQLVFSDDVDDKAKEAAIMQLGELLAKSRRGEELAALVGKIRPYFGRIAKAKTAKIVRQLLEQLSTVDGSLPLQIGTTKESIEWTRVEKRTFLRHRLEARLADLHLQAKEYPAALALTTHLLREVKRLDDKAMLLEIFLLESRIQLALRNVAKAKASLTAARTNANAIYCGAALQAQLDLQSGILHAEEHDYKTAYSYFWESFEAYSSLDCAPAPASALAAEAATSAAAVGSPARQAVVALKYMLLCKIMLSLPKDVPSIISGKVALRYAGRDVEAMRSVANALSQRSLQLFSAALEAYSAELTHDELISGHLAELYDTLLQQNLARLIEPFSCIEVAHVASLIDLPVPLVERKLSQMILDKKFEGILDQGAGRLIVFDEAPTDRTFPASLETLQSMGKVVDALYTKASLLS